MRLFHFSDTHLGFSDLDVTENGINVREKDFYEAFNQVVEAIKKEKPDYIIHTGDFFHRVSPSNRAITFGLDKLKEIDKLNIPFILIAGNHEVPRNRETAAIFKIFTHFKNIYPVFEDYEVVEFERIAFHAIPHLNDNKLETIQKVKPIENKKNVLLLHLSVGKKYIMEEFGEWVLDENCAVFDKMDYVGLGHWHGFKKVKENVYYSGSTERTSFSDKREKGYLIVDLNTKKVEFKKIDLREFKTIEIDANNISFPEIDVKKTILEVVVKNLTPAKVLEIDSLIREKYKDALYIFIKREFKNTDLNIDANKFNLKEAFLDFIEEKDKQLKSLAKEMFERVENDN